MTVTRLLLTTGLALSLAGASPAFAQHRGGGGGGNRGGGAARGAVRGGGYRAPAPRSGGAPRAPMAGPRAGSRPSFGGGYARGAYGYSRYGGGGYARGAYGYSRYGGGGYARGAYGYSRYGGGYARGGYGYSRYGYAAPLRFYRPYYAFRPRFSIGFGLWVGFPIAYSAAYYDPWYDPYAYPYPYYPYGYRYPYSYSAPAYPPAYPPAAYPSSQTYAYPSAPAYAPDDPSQGSVGVQPDATAMGGLSFNITPGSAQVFVDGSYAGTVDEFTPTSQPLGLAAGRHRVEIRATGYRTMSFDVDVIAGQVIPYQGSLER